MNTDERTKNALTTLSSISRDDGYRSEDLRFIMRNVDRFIQLYVENGIVRSLTHQVLYNSEVAHYFIISLEDYRELWEHREMQEAVADALRRGDSLLVDVLSFLEGYTDIGIIHDALVEHIRNTESITFQISILGSMGLSEEPEIKQVILDRKHDVIAGMLLHWHEAGPVSFVPCLMQDEQVKNVILGFKLSILKALKEDDSVLDIAMLVKNAEWIRNDEDIMKGVRKRLIEKKFGIESTLIKAVKQHNLHHWHPALKKALEPYDYL